jgi:DGQHR domain-containing protein
MAPSTGSASTPKFTDPSSWRVGGARVSFEALRGKQGDRTIYVILPDNATLNNLIPPDMEPAGERAERVLDPKHAADIADYIRTNPKEYVLGALTYASDQEGEFEEAFPGARIGIWHLPLSARLRVSDGQHRRHGGKQVLDASDAVDWFGQQHTAVLVYVEDDLTKRKQMFSDMNWTPRVVNKSVNVNFNSRDVVARVTQRLVAEHPLLAGRTEAEKGWITKASRSLYTLGAVYEAVRCLTVGASRGRTPVLAEDTVYADADAFFTLLMDARPELQEVLDKPETTEGWRAASILLNGTTLKMLATAIFSARGSDHGLTFAELVHPVERLDFAPNAPLWRYSGFVPAGTTTPSSRNQEVRAAVQAVLAVLTGTPAEEVANTLKQGAEARAAAAAQAAQAAAAAIQASVSSAMVTSAPD